MKRTGVILLVAALVVVLTVPTGATSANSGPAIELPVQARTAGPNVFYLGSAIHNGRAVEGLLFIHTAGVAHPAKGGIPGPPDGNNDEPPPDAPVDPATCYSFIDPAGAHWTSPEPWLFDGSASGIGVSMADMDAALDAWDEAADGSSIFGGGSSDTGLDVALDDSNEVFFARLVGPGAGNVIAATWVWYEPGGAIDEWDMVFNTKYSWSLNGAPNAMDFLNIATHEAGHAAGMGHTEAIAECEAQTMYPSASYGETEKRDLDVGDVAGIGALY